MSIDFKEIYRESKIQGIFRVFYLQNQEYWLEMKHTIDFGNYFIVQR